MNTLIKKQICDECGEHVFPVCLNCYNEEFVGWLRDNIGEEDLIKIILRKAILEVTYSNEEKTSCILCKKKSAPLCKKCYFSDVLNVLQEMNMPNKGVISFIRTFN